MMRLAVLTASMILLVQPTCLLPHNRDMDNLDRTLELRLGDGFIDLRLFHAYKEFPSLDERARMDRNGDRVIEPAEASAYAGQYAEEALGRFTLTVDGREAAAHLLDEPSLDLYGSSRVIPQHHDIDLRYSLPLDNGPGMEHRLVLRRNGPAGPDHPGRDDFALILGRSCELTNCSLDMQPGNGGPLPDEIRFTVRVRSATQVDSAAAAGEGLWRVAAFHRGFYRPGGDFAMSGQTVDAVESEQDSHKEEHFAVGEMVREYLEGDEGGATGKALWLLILAAFVYGAAHALTPGHAKSLTAAYLVGTSHNWVHALALAAVVTLTHTASILILAVVTSLAWGGGPGESMQGALTALSGLIVFCLGMQRLRAGRPGHHHAEHPGHGHPHPHDHVQQADTGKGESSLRQIVWLGFAGGLAPCPGALWIYFLTLGFGKPGLGIVLIVALSFGLAAVLSIVGLATIYFRGLLRAGAGEESAVAARLPGWITAAFHRLYHALPAIAGTALALAGSWLIWRGLGTMGWF